ncbi:DUF397 domain-containing protein [Streptomyces sp. NPDC059575]|uniref:DUF397 domain-containing protein n=1 Tax=Streptomyces sp. NPDC059575 TaxID=3346872 RepID=UPI003682BB8A
MEHSTPEFDLSAAAWHKSSYSGGEGGNCVEVAAHPTHAPVRDSKNLGPKLVFPADAWSAFVEDLKHD